MTSAAHAVLAVAAWVYLRWLLQRPAFTDQVAEVEALTALTVAVLIASAAGSAAAVAAGRGAWSPRRALLLDGASVAATVWALAVLALAPWTRELGGIVLVTIVAIRLAPGIAALVSGRARPWTAFVAAFGAYGAMAAWLPVASLPFGDQVHYLVAAEHLRAGRVDVALDPAMFTRLLGVPPSAADAATHIADTPLGPRPIQGYALQALILPGWAVGERIGAGLVLALVGAWTSYQLFLILRDLRQGGALPPLGTAPSGGRGARGNGDAIAGLAWLVATVSAPMSLLATHIYPNIVGAAIVATAFRYGFTAPIRRPALAAALLGLLLFLTPRDAVPLLVLGAFLLTDGAARRSVAIALGVMAVGATALNLALYGLPIPYAGYAFGTLQAQELTQERSVTFFVWVTLPAILFDRTFGLAGSAPWVFVGLVGLIPALLWERERLRTVPAARPVLAPAALAVGASVLALSFFRLWEGGYAPPARYFVDVLPLWVPFVALGLGVTWRAFRGGPGGARSPGPSARPAGATLVAAIVATALGMSALSAWILNAVPSLALNSAFDDKIRHALAQVLGIDPLGWLPSFQPVTPDWYVSAYLSLVPAILVTGVLIAGGLIARAAAGGPSTARRDTHRVQNGTGGSSALAGWAVVNLLAVGWVVLAGREQWIATAPDVTDSLLSKWLPFALAIAAIGSAAVARALPPEERGAFLRRHLIVYLAPIALTLVAYFGGPQVVPGQLGAIYLLIALVFAVNALTALWRALRRGVPAPAGSPPGDRPLGDRAVALQLGLVALVAALVLLPYHRTVMPTASDEPHYLLITQSLLYDGDLDLRNDYLGDRYEVFYPARLPDVHGIVMGDAVYPIRDVGLPALAVAPFAVGGRLGVLAVICVIGAALVALLYLLLRDLRFDPRVAFLGAATTGLVHPIFTYTTQVYPELLTALVFLVAARALRRGADTTLRDLALASALVGTLPWLSTRALPVVLGVGLVVAWAALWPAVRDRAPLSRVALRVLAGALPFAALLAALMYLNWRMFGVAIPSAGYFLIRDQQQVLTYTPWIGAPGLMFDRVFGLIPRAPVYLLGFVGIAALWRRRAGHGPQLAVLALGALASFVYIADIHYWWADGSPPSRYLLGSLPLFVAAVAGGWEVVLAARAAWPRALAAAAVAASVAVAFVYAVLPNIRYDLALRILDSGSSGGLFVYVSQAVGLNFGRAFPSLVIRDPLSVALAVAWVAAAVALFWLARRSPALASRQ